MPSRQTPNLPGQDYRIAAIPELSDFVHLAEDRLSSGNSAAFWTLERDLLALVNGRFLQELVNYELGRVIKEPFYGPPSSSSRQFTLYISEHFTLSLVILSPHSTLPSRLQGLTRNAIMTVVAGDGLDVRRYYSEIANFDVFDRTSALRVGEELRICKGQTFLIKAGEEVVDVRAEGPTVFLSLISSPVHDIMWEYDRATLYPVKAVSDNLATSRIEYALRVISQVGDRSHADTVESLFAHPTHTVRWASIKTLMHIDEERGVRLLESAISDEHPHVRTAALKSLERVRQLQQSNAMPMEGAQGCGSHN